MHAVREAGTISPRATRTAHRLPGIELELNREPFVRVGGMVTLRLLARYG